MPESPELLRMPRYKCHKEVYALKIKSVTGHSGGFETAGRILEHAGVFVEFEDSRYPPIDLPFEYRNRNPSPGGYYIVYDDGYQSFSPARAFEGGYTKV